MDLLIKKIIEKKNPTVAGLDPKLDYVPEYIIRKNFEKYGVVENSSQYSSPASSAPSTPQTKSKKASPKPAAPAPSSPDYDSALEGLL